MAVSVELVRECVRIVKTHKAMPLSPMTKSLVREMELLLEQLDLLHRRRLEFLNRINSFHRETRNQLLNIRRDPHESAELRIERNSNQQRYTLTLMQLESQRRDIHATFDPDLRNMEMRLAELLSEHELLSLENGDR